MTELQAAQLMGVLLLPKLVKRAPNGGIELGEGAHPVVWDLVNGAANGGFPSSWKGWAVGSRPSGRSACTTRRRTTRPSVTLIPAIQTPAQPGGIGHRPLPPVEHSVLVNQSIDALLHHGVQGINATLDGSGRGEVYELQEQRPYPASIGSR
jgi:hypothetical protein